MALGQLGDDAFFARALGILKSLEPLSDNMGAITQQRAARQIS